MSLPSWIKKRAPKEGMLQEMKHLLRSLSLHTVCEEARCPNIGECFAKKTATFMILGNSCTRNCRFCAVEKGDPFPLDLSEPENVARAVKRLGLRYAVITSVTRDDLPDGGASQFARTIKAIRRINKDGIRIEILIPDFKGSLSSLKAVIEARPDVLNHNLETVSRLYGTVRPKADYSRSLELLRRSKEMNSGIYTKSGLMVGLGEDFGEVVAVMKDLREVGCDILTLGQYLRPSPEHLEVKEFVKPEKFRKYEKVGRSLGFSYVAAFPFVRSSYQAKEALEKIKEEPHHQIKGVKINENLHHG